MLHAAARTPQMLDLPRLHIRDERKHSAMMMNMLNAALPTMVLGPRSPAVKLWPHTSITEESAGAEDQGHQGQVGHCLIPDPQLCGGLSIGFSLW